MFKLKCKKQTICGFTKVYVLISLAVSSDFKRHKGGINCNWVVVLYLMHWELEVENRWIFSHSHKLTSPSSLVWEAFKQNAEEVIFTSTNSNTQCKNTTLQVKVQYSRFVWVKAQSINSKMYLTYQK